MVELNAFPLESFLIVSYSSKGLKIISKNNYRSYYYGVSKQKIMANNWA